jgi:hypothetical protein
MPKHKKNEMKSKRHRVYRPGASRMRPDDKVTARINSNVVKERRETARRERLNKMAKDSAIAIQQKARDIAAATARASARIAAEASRRAELASLVPPTASARVTRKKKTVKLSPSSLELALLEQEAKEKAAAERLEQRKAKAKEVKELFQKTQKAKKNRERQVRLEKRYDLEHLSYENALAEKRTELLARGVREAEAEAQAKFWADHYADPKLRVLMDGKMAWGDVALKETPPKVEPKAKGTTAATAALVPLVPEPSIRVPTLDYRKAARKAPEFVPDYKTLIVLNLPYEPGKKIDRRKLWTSVSGKLTGTEIFGSARPTDVKVVIMIMLPNGTQPKGDIYQSKTDEPLKVMAFVTYPSHELAKKALEFSKMRGLYIKEKLLAVQPNLKK